MLNGKYGLKSSNNIWDCLGESVYFWEENPGRALEYATECAVGKQRFSGEIKTPFVIGAIIELGNCLNLLEPMSILIIKNAHAGLINLLELLSDKVS